jgi:DNA-binding NarL/FixJ family response regulator
VTRVDAPGRIGQMSRVVPVAEGPPGRHHRPMGPRILIVDDHASFRGLARRLLSAGGFDVIGEAAGAIEALAEIDRLAPDVVLLDIQLPDGDGFGVAAALRLSARPPAIVLVSSRSPADYGSRIGASGAAGFIAKADLSPETLRRALEECGT